MIQATNFNPVRMYVKRNREIVLKAWTPERQNFKNLTFVKTYRNAQEAMNTILFPFLNPSSTAGHTHRGTVTGRYATSDVHWTQVK